MESVCGFRDKRGRFYEDKKSCEISDLYLDYDDKFIKFANKLLENFHYTSPEADFGMRLLINDCAKDEKTLTELAELIDLKILINNTELEEDKEKNTLARIKKFFKNLIS